MLSLRLRTGLSVHRCTTSFCLGSVRALACGCWRPADSNWDTRERSAYFSRFHVNVLRREAQRSAREGAGAPHFKTPFRAELEFYVFDVVFFPTADSSVD